MTHCVLGHHTRFDELEEIVGAARLGADARAAVAAKWLTSDDRSSDVAVHVEVPDRCPVDDVVDGRRAPGEEAAGKRERGSVDRVARSFHVLDALDGEQRAEDLLADDARLAREIGRDPRATEPALAWRVGPRRGDGPLARRGARVLLDPLLRL